MIPTLLVVAVIIFVLVRVIPGDIVELRLVSGGSFVTKSVIEAERARLGLNKPIWRQFVDWMSGLPRFDLGSSMWTAAPIIQEIALRFQLTLQLAIMSTLIAVAIALPLGIPAAVPRGPGGDYGVQSISVAGLPPPSFCLAILLCLRL